MNKNKLRWKLYNKLNRHGLIIQKKGGYSLERLIGFVESLQECPSDLSFVDPTTYTGMLYIFEQIDHVSGLEAFQSEKNESRTRK